jgi:hypothetical protein
LDAEQGQHLGRGDADAAADPDDPGWPGAGLDRLVGAAAADAQQAGGLDDGECGREMADLVRGDSGVHG